MSTSVIGFPRIGKNRELKFASEKFFKGEISEKELNERRKEHQKARTENQKNAGMSSSLQTIFHSMTMYWTLQSFLTLSPKIYRSWVFPSSRHILQWQEDIRAIRVT